ncbi:Dedicator of cytokinesis protein 7, partial [Cichlidogyrus casuarinus]
MYCQITGIMTQGRGALDQWVSSYMVSYSEDGSKWRYILDQYGSQKIFEGNSDSFGVKHNYLDDPIIARFIKIH